MKPYRIIQGDVLAGLTTLPDASVHCCVTSPPYWGLRDYGVDGQLGLEPTPAEYVAKMVAVFREVRRVLRDDGTLWLNLGDSYASNTKGDARTPDQLSSSSTLGPKRNGLGGGNAAHMAHSLAPVRVDHGLKAKDLVGIPWRVAFALQADGWYLRSDIIWSKPNPMPESVTDRPTKAHEYLFLLSKSERYHYDADAIKDPVSDLSVKASGPNERTKSLAKLSVASTGGAISGGTEQSTLGCVVRGTRNKRSVWEIGSEPYAGAHFAVMPTALVKPCILAGCPTGGTVLDPFTGSGTVAVVAIEHGCDFVGCELNPEYVKIAEDRIAPVAAQGNLFHGATS